MTMTRRRLLITGVGGLITGGVGNLLSASPAHGYFGAPANSKRLEDLLLQDLGDMSQLPINPFVFGVGRLQVQQLVNISQNLLGDLPSLGDVQLGAIPGLIDEIRRNGLFIPCNVNSLKGIGSCDYTKVLVSEVKGLLQQTIGNWTSILGMPLRTLPELPNFNFSTVPGLGLLNYLSSNIFTGLPCAPAVAELVAFRQSSQSPSGGVRYAIDRGRAWNVGEYRYINSAFRIQLDSIGERPGNANYHSEVLVCSFGICVWLPLPWPSLQEKTWSLWVN
jgi:hypothetical protein